MLCKHPGMRLQVKRLSRTRPPRLSSLEQKYFSKVSSGIGKSWQMPPLSFKPFTINAKRHWVQKGKVSTVQPLRVSRLHTAMNLALLTHNGLSAISGANYRVTEKGGKPQNYRVNVNQCMMQYLNFSRNWFLWRILVLAAQVRKVRINVNYEKSNSGNTGFTQPTANEHLPHEWVRVSAEAYRHICTCMWWARHVLGVWHLLHTLLFTEAPSKVYFCPGTARE